MNPPAKILILACGNTLRGDDGLGWHALQQLKSLLFESPGLEFYFRTQFTLDLTVLLCDADLALFVDARQGATPGQIDIRDIVPRWNCSGGTLAHHSSPEQLLALSLALYGKAPCAIACSMTAESFECGENLSPTVNAALPEFVARISDALKSRLLVQANA